MTEWWALTCHTIVLAPAGGSYFASLPTGPHSDQPSSFHHFPHPLFLLQGTLMARFGVNCLRESVVSTLVKGLEAELLRVIKASYLHNTSRKGRSIELFSRALWKLSSPHPAVLLLPWRPGAEAWK